MSERIVIIGNGISGITCARHLRKNNASCEIIVISGETDYFFSRTALMYIYMGHMKFEHTKPYEDWFWTKNRIQLKRVWVTKINTDQNELVFDDATTLNYHKLIIASGSTSNKFDWPGQNLAGVQGLYSYQDLQLMEQNTQNIKNAVIVGGGLIGVEMAEMLHSRGIHVTFLIREHTFWGNVLPKADGDFISAHLKNDYGISLKFNTQLQSIIDDGSGKVKAVITNNGEEINCEFVGLAVGVSPNVEFLKSSAIELDKGVLINSRFETNIPNVFAIGDCAQFKSPPKGRKPIEQGWYTGRMMGELLAKNLTTNNSTAYQPGPWFNSAKFFDVEYQTYGEVKPNLPEQKQAFIWQDLENRRMLHFRFNTVDEVLIGVNAFGIRLRHEVFDAWLRQQKTIDEVLTKLADANFDPEFYKTFEQEVIGEYNKQFGKKLKVKTKSWKRILNPFSA